MELKELIERVKAATGPDRGLDEDIRFHFDPLGSVFYSESSAYTASIDAALSLVERCLPGCAWSVTEPHDARKRKRKPDNVRVPFDAYIANNDNVGVPGHVFALTEGPTPALTLLLALLTALDQKEENK